MERVWKTVFSSTSFCIRGVISLSVCGCCAANVKRVWDMLVHKTGQSNSVWEKKVTRSELLSMAKETGMQEKV